MNIKYSYRGFDYLPDKGEEHFDIPHIYHNIVRNGKVVLNMDSQFSPYTIPTEQEFQNFIDATLLNKSLVF